MGRKATAYLVGLAGVLLIVVVVWRVKQGSFSIDKHSSTNDGGDLAGSQGNPENSFGGNDTRSTKAAKEFSKAFLSKLTNSSAAKTSADLGVFCDELRRFLSDNRLDLRELLGVFLKDEKFRLAFTVLREAVALSEELQTQLAGIVLSDAPQEVRLLSVHLLDSFSKVQPIDRRMELLQQIGRDPSDAVAKELVVFVGHECNDSSVVQCLIELLKRPKAVAQSEVLETLTRSQNGEAKQYVRGLLEDPKTPIALKSTALSWLTDSTRADPKSAEFAWLEIVAMDAIGLSAGEDLTPERRVLFSSATELLAKRDNIAAVTKLLEVFGSAKDRGAKVLVAYNLRWFPRDNVRSSLLAAVADSNEEVGVRKASLNSVVLMIDPGVKVALDRLVNDANTPEELRKIAMQALGKKTPEKSAPKSPGN